MVATIISGFASFIASFIVSFICAVGPKPITILEFLTLCIYWYCTMSSIMTNLSTIKTYYRQPLIFEGDPQPCSFQTCDVPTSSQRLVHHQLYPNPHKLSLVRMPRSCVGLHIPSQLASYVFPVSSDICSNGNPQIWTQKGDRKSVV